MFKTWSYMIRFVASATVPVSNDVPFQRLPDMTPSTQLGVRNHPYLLRALTPTMSCKNCGAARLISTISRCCCPLAAIPLLFAGWLNFIALVGEVFGVALPLTVMFGLLFVSVFVILYRSLSRIHCLETRVIALTQEIALIDDCGAMAERSRARWKVSVLLAGADTAARK